MVLTVAQMLRITAESKTMTFGVALTRNRHLTPICFGSFSPGFSSTKPTVRCMSNLGPRLFKLIFYSCAPVFDVSPLLMGQESDRSDKHSATPHRIIPLKSRSETV